MLWNYTDECALSFLKVYLTNILLKMNGEEMCHYGWSDFRIWLRPVAQGSLLSALHTLTFNLNESRFTITQSDVSCITENEILFKLINKKKIKGILFTERLIDIGSYKKLNLLQKQSELLKNKAFFLDRDGVINKDDGYILKFSQFNNQKNGRRNKHVFRRSGRPHAKSGSTHF